VNLTLEGRKAFAYTAAHELDPKKPTIAFVHGAGLDHSSFGLQSRYFGYHGRNVLAVDLPGHGRSAGPPLGSIAGMAAWLLKFTKEVSCETISIVGHSMGSLVALECAAREPSRVERIALLGTAHPMKVGAEFLDAAKRDHMDAFAMSTIWGHAAQVPLGGNPNPGMWMYGDTLARLRRLAPGVLYSDLKACNDYEFKGEVRCPVLMVLGDRDVMTPPRNALSLSQRFSSCEIRHVPASGHTMMAESPDATLDALIKFFG
jgi:pimeloyl-ACP methyl ester carboxylesterase